MNIYIYVYQYPSGENDNDSLSRTHQPHCEPLALRSLAVVICNWTVPLSMHARSLLLMAVIATCVFMIFSAALYLYIYIYIEYYTPAVNYIAMENHHLLIGHTSSNGCFAIVMFVFFSGLYSPSSARIQVECQYPTQGALSPTFHSEVCCQRGRKFRKCSLWL